MFGDDAKAVRTDFFIFYILHFNFSHFKAQKGRSESYMNNSAATAAGVIYNSERPLRSVLILC